MTDKLVNLRDIRFVLYEVLKVEGLLDSERYSGHSRETFDMAIDAAYKLAREVFWPAYAYMDRNGVTYDAKTQKTRVPESMHTVWAAYEGRRLVRQHRPAEQGGQQFPGTVGARHALIFNAANTAAHMYIGGAVRRRRT